MERTQLFDLMGELKLYGMKAAFDEIMATAVKRQHEPQRIVGDLLNAEISEKQARSIKYQLTIAKLPLAKDLDDFQFEGTPINETVHDPRGYPPNVIGKRLAARPQSLVGKTLYLVDCLFDNSETFMDQLKHWFAEHLPSVDTRMIKPRESWVDDPAMRQKVAADGHAAVLGVGL